MTYEPTAAVVGGNYDGTESYNPATGAVLWVDSNFPTATGYITTPGLVSVDGGRSIIYYEGTDLNTGHTTRIWQFNQTSNSWLFLQQLPVSINDFSALPVGGIRCP